MVTACPTCATGSWNRLDLASQPLCRTHSREWSRRADLCAVEGACSRSLPRRFCVDHQPWNAQPYLYQPRLLAWLEDAVFVITGALGFLVLLPMLDWRLLARNTWRLVWGHPSSRSTAG